MKATFSEPLVMTNDFEEVKQLNYFDHGPGSMKDIDLAINEVDRALASNINFRSSDAFKILITSAGLDELRTVLHY
jgi:hypothetical protein